MKSPATSFRQQKPDLTPGTRIFGVSGSPRRNGNSDVILHTILTGARRLTPTNRVNLTDIHFTGCIGCEQCRKNSFCSGLVDGMTVLYEHIIASRGLVLVCPTHHYNITSWMKAFIDRLYCFYTFTEDRPRGWSSRLAHQGRKAAIAAVCEQSDHADMGFTVEAMAQPLTALGYEVVGTLPIYGIFDKGGVKQAGEVLKQAERLGRQLARSITGSTG